MHDPIPPKTNPREFFPQHKERGRGKFHYSVLDVAETLGVSIWTVYNMKRRKGAKTVDISVLRDVCEEYHRRELKKAK